MGIGRLPIPLGAAQFRKQYVDATKASLGDAFDLDADVRRVEVEALGNVFATLRQAVRSVQAEALPDCANRKLESWAFRLGVPTYSETDQRVRDLMAAKYKVQAATILHVTRLIEDTLGRPGLPTSNLVDIHLTTGETAQENTFWNGINPGESEDLNGDALGQWLSARSHIIITVRPVQGQTEGELIQELQTRLFQTLDPVIPCWVTWEWQIAESGFDGFDLDIDRLDVTALT